MGAGVFTQREYYDYVIVKCVTAHRRGQGKLRARLGKAQEKHDLRAAVPRMPVAPSYLVGDETIGRAAVRCIATGRCLSVQGSHRTCDRRAPPPRRARRGRRIPCVVRRHLQRRCRSRRPREGLEHDGSRCTRSATGRRRSARGSRRAAPRRARARRMAGRSRTRRVARSDGRGTRAPRRASDRPAHPGDLPVGRAGHARSPKC